MTPRLRILAPGLATTVQDAGRLGHQRFGVPVSGALDAEALAAANIVVGNEAGTAALECLYQGPVFEVEDAPVRLAIAGAGASLEAVAGSDAPVVTGQATSITAAPGTRVRVLMTGPGIAAVVAVSGGIDVPPVLGSRSTYVRSALGGFEGRALRTGDVVPVGAAASGGPERHLPGIDFLLPDTVRVVMGPQDDAFTPDTIAAFLGARYVVTRLSDRMGLRLSGPRLMHKLGPDIASDATAWGSVQVPGDGQPIVLLADRQTTGGYTKIATVIGADLPALSRCGPGHEVAFRAVTMDEATAATRAAAAERAGWPARLEPVVPLFDPERLLRLNLIDGVADARL